MSKERARLRALRLAEAEAARAKRARRRRRREWRRSLVRRMIPRLPDRRTGRLVRRTSGQRATIAVTVCGVLFLVWKFAPSLSLKIACTLLIAAVTPVAVLLTFDRRTRSWL